MRDLQHQKSHGEIEKIPKDFFSSFLTNNSMANLVLTLLNKTKNLKAPWSPLFHVWTNFI